MLRTTGLLLALICTALCTNAAEPPAGLPAPEIFARDTAVDGVELSPDGTRVALITQSEDVDKLSIVNVADGKMTLLAARKLPDSIYGVQWKSDRYLFYQAVMERKPLLAGIDFNRNSKQFRVNLSGQRIHFADMRWGDPNRLLLNYGFGEIAELILRDTSPGFGFGKSHYLFDHAAEFTIDSKAQVRTALTWEKGDNRRLFYRDNNDDTWRELLQFKEESEETHPVGFTDDDRQLYVISNVGRDTTALFRYDPATKTFSEPVFAAEGADIIGLNYSSGMSHLVSVEYEAHGGGTYYVDPRVDAIHRATRKALPNLQTDVISLDASMKRAIVRARSTQTPGSLYFFDQTAGALTTLIDLAPWINPAQMAPVQPFKATARDGLPLHGYLVLPRAGAGKNLPLIVSLTGDRWGSLHTATFDGTAQFLASRGYAVLNLNPRGSVGYGRRYREAAFENWHSAVQNDIIDSIDSLVSAGIADRSRLGILGKGFGGYVAMLSLTTHPDLFKTAILYGGFADPQVIVGLRRIYTGSLTYSPITMSESQLTVLLGTRSEVGQEDRSPLKRLDRIRAPVFIAHGTKDTVVPFAEAKKLAHALSGKPGAVSGFMPEDEGHTFRREANRTELYRRLERFLTRTLGPSVPNAPAPAAEPLEIPADEGIVDAAHKN